MKTLLATLALGVLCLGGLSGCESDGEDVAEDRMEQKADRLEDRADEMEDRADDLEDQADRHD